jgi:tyrosyl-tRNA synthetase
MIAKESVRARMEDREAGISYTEFSYMLLQAFDFYHLRKEHGCELQIGGSDQWGNITAGSDLCRKKLGAQVFGLTLPLITNADGSKFGKTVAGAVWLDAKKTSVYKFYQFWINTDDRDVIRYLKFFTFLPLAGIQMLEKAHLENPGARVAHRDLASNVTELIHGKHATDDAIAASGVFFGGDIYALSEGALEQIVDEIKPINIPKSLLGGTGKALVELLVETGLCSSKGQAKKDIEGGGISINNQREADPKRAIMSGDFLLAGKYLFLRKGKKNYAAVRFID